MFTPVTREKNRLRLALDGPSGSGKTYTALRFAFALAGKEGKVAVVDTEHNSATKYQGENPDGIPWQWDGCNLESFAPSTYEQVIKYAGQQGYDVLVIDSLSHAWMGIGGALDQIDRSSGNRFTAWRDVTPQHNEMIEAILASPCHVIATLRSKMEYVLEESDKGKMEPRKVGVKPIQREGVEYEFDIIGDLDLDHRLRVSKSRCSLVDGKVVHKPDAMFMGPVKDWLFSGVEAKPKNGNVTLKLAGGGTVLRAAAPGQVDENAWAIKDLCKKLGMGPEGLKAILARRSRSKLSELSDSDASSLRKKLEAKLLAKEGEAAF